jgi:hypothetical protein
MPSFGGKTLAQQQKLVCRCSLLLHLAQALWLIAWQHVRLNRSVLWCSLIWLLTPTELTAAAAAAAMLCAASCGRVLVGTENPLAP